MDAIPADFFSDLVPIKPNGSREPAAPKAAALHTDAVLPSRPDASSPSAAALDAAGRGNLAGMQPMGDSRLRREVKEFEGATQAVVESILQRFANGLKGVLEDTNRRLESLENRTEQVSSMLADVQKVEGLREDAMKERFSSLERTLRDIHRGVQIVRDKQELLEAQTELAKLSHKGAEDAAGEAAPVPAASADSTAVVPRAATSALAPAPAPPVTAEAPPPPPPTPAAPPAPPPPAPVVPPAPAATAPSAPLPPSAPHQEPQPPPPPPLAHQHSAPPMPPPSYVPPPPPPPPPQQQQSYGPGPPPLPAYTPALPGPPPPGQPPLGIIYPGPMGGPPGGGPGWAPLPPRFMSAPPAGNPYGAFLGAAMGGPNGGASAGYGSSAPPQPPSPAYGGAAMPPASYGGPMACAAQSYPSLPQSPFPNAPPASNFAGFSGGPPPPRVQPASSHGSGERVSGGGGSGGAGGGAGAAQATRSMPLEEVIDDVANMGFSRHEVRAVVTELMDSGQSIDLNVVLDRLMNGRR